MDFYHVPQPHHLPSKERQSELIDLLLQGGPVVNQIWRKSSHPYLGWSKFSAKYRSGVIVTGEEYKKLPAEEAWFLLGVRRRLLRSKSPVKAGSEYFGYYKSPAIEKLLHNLDMQLGGNIASHTLGDDRNKRERYLRQSLVEEAIASSQLEGAATTRPVAKKMLTENKKPKTEGEWMIYNNYQTIRKIEQETSNYPLSREVLLDLHTLMTTNTIKPNEQGRWRNDEDEIVVKRMMGGEEYVVHIPPREDVLQKEIDRLIAFANDEESQDEYFLHPILKAIIIHFWFAYLHPFCDGNGRLSRSLVYWYLLKHGYWFIGYVPISTAIKKSASAYADSYLFSEQYDNDMTYFIEYNLSKMNIALQQFNEHIHTVKKKTSAVDSLLPEKHFNNRQKQVLHHLLGKPTDFVTAQRHAAFHEVAWVTASNDLKELAKHEYITPERHGREVLYSASRKLLDLGENL